jgi:hypothetical protein
LLATTHSNGAPSDLKRDLFRKNGNTVILMINKPLYSYYQS